MSFFTSPSRGPSFTRLPAGARVAFLGDSITDHALEGTTTSLFSMTRSGINWAFARDPRFNHVNYWVPSATDARYHTGHNHGVSGDKSADLLARLPAVLAQKPDLAIVAIGHNDVFNVFDYTIPIANIGEIVRQLRAAGIRVGLMTIRPKVAGTGGLKTGIGSAMWTGYHELNTWIRQQAAPGVDIIDPQGMMSDQSTDVFTDGRQWFYSLKPAFTTDDIHLTPLGGWAEHHAILDYLRSQIEPGVVFESNHLLAGNLLANANFTGTAGVFAGGAVGSGTLASNWQMQRNAGTGGTVAASIEAEGATNKQVLTFGPGGTSIWENHSFKPYLSDKVTSGFAVGDWVLFGAYVEMSTWGRWRGITANMVQQNVSNATQFTTRGFARYDNGSDVWPLPAEGWAGWVVAPITQIVSTVTQLAPSFDIVTAPNGAPNSGTLKISRPFLRKVGAPVV